MQDPSKGADTDCRKKDSQEKKRRTVQQRPGEGGGGREGRRGRGRRLWPLKEPGFFSSLPRSWLPQDPVSSPPSLSSSSHRKRRRGGRCMREDRGGVRLIERRGPTAGAAGCCNSLLQLLDAEIHRDNLIPYGIMDSSGSG